MLFLLRSHVVRTGGWTPSSFSHLELAVTERALVLCGEDDGANAAAEAITVDKSVSFIIVVCVVCVCCA